MKYSFYAAAALVAAGLGACSAEDSFVTAQQKISASEARDFMYNLGGPEPEKPIDGVELRAANLGTLPALEGQGISMTLVNLDACTINLPRVHPRATEMIYMIEGDLTSAFVEENNGEGAVINELAKGDVAFFPKGLIHYQQNLGCYPATFLAALNNEDPGAVTITTRFFDLPSMAIQASLNFEDPQLKALVAALPQTPAMARHECLKRCGLQTHSRSLTKKDGRYYSGSSDSGSSDSGSSDSGSSDSGSSDSDSSDGGKYYHPGSGDSSSSDSSSSDSSSSDSSSSDSSSDDGSKHRSLTYKHSSGSSDSGSSDSGSSDSGSSDSDSSDGGKYYHPGSGDSGSSDSSSSDSSSSDSSSDDGSKHRSLTYRHSSGSSDSGSSDSGSSDSDSSDGGKKHLRA